MAGIKRRFGSLLGPEGRTPQFIEGTTTQVAPSEPARVDLTKIGDARYQVDFQVPKGLDGDPTAVADLDQATALHVNTADTATQQAVVATVNQHATPPQGTRTTLDIWPGFERNGSSQGSWDATTYQGFIDGIDARLVGRNVTKESIGTDTDGSTIWAYTAGPVDAPHALLVAGTHSIESLPQFAAMRYFTEFVDHPEMRARRARLKITWIPVLTPSSYMAARYNSAGVDPARNYDFFWEYWSEPNNHPKGDAPLDQPGPQAVKGLLDKYKIAAVIDAHTAQSGMWWDGPSTWTLGNKPLAFNAGSRWDQTYNYDDAVPSGQYGTGAEGLPQLINWANTYLLFEKERHNAAVFLIESGNDLGGSVSLTRMTREGARLYCGMIDTFLMEWLENGQHQPQQVPRMANGSLTIQRPTMPLIDGGTLIDSNSYTPMHFNQTPGQALPSEGRDFFDFPIPGRGQIEVRAWAQVRATSENAAPTGAGMRIGLGATPVEGGGVTLSSGMQAAQRDIEPGLEIGLNASWRGIYTEPQLLRVQLGFAVVGPAYRTLEILRAQVFLTWYPDKGAARSPIVHLQQ